MRRDRLGDVGHLVHHLFVDVQAAGGIDDHHVVAVGLGLFDRVPGNLDGVLDLLTVDGNIRLLAEHLELLDSGRSLQIVGDHQRMAALADQIAAQLGGRGGFATALETGQHDDRRSRRDEVNPRIDRAHQLGQFVVDDLDHDLAGVEALDHLGAQRGFAHVFAELLDDVVVDVGFEQGFAHVPHRVGNVGLGDPTATGQRFEDRIEFFC